MLNPDNSVNILKKYHLVNKVILPSLCINFLTQNYVNDSKLNKGLLSLNSALLGFHSYVSMSTIITDYIKPNLRTAARVNNVGIHGIVLASYLYNLNK